MWEIIFKLNINALPYCYYWYIHNCVLLTLTVRHCYKLYNPVIIIFHFLYSIAPNPSYKGDVGVGPPPQMGAPVGPTPPIAASRRPGATPVPPLTQQFNPTMSVVGPPCPDVAVTPLSVDGTWCLGALFSSGFYQSMDRRDMKIVIALQCRMSSPSIIWEECEATYTVYSCAQRYVDATSMDSLLFLGNICTF